MSQCWTFTSSFALKLIYYFQGTDLCHLFFLISLIRSLGWNIFSLFTFILFFFCISFFVSNLCILIHALLLISLSILKLCLLSSLVNHTLPFTIPFSKVLVVRRFWDPALLLLLRKHIYFCQDFYCFTI